MPQEEITKTNVSNPTPDTITPPDAELIGENINSRMFSNRLKTYNGMYKTEIDADRFTASVSDAWDLLTSDDEQRIFEGKQMLRDLFADTLKDAFDIEKSIAHEDQRLPNYTEIIKSTNDLLRVSMFAFTDMYINVQRTSLFDITAFGGMSSQEMAALTSDEGVWKGDQRSDPSWDVQSSDARAVSGKWARAQEPYEEMTKELDGLLEASKNGVLDIKDAMNKLAAAEIILMNDEAATIKDPADDHNKLPNFGNSHWQSMISTKEALGIPKYISMRELIQGNYAEMQKTVSNVFYNEQQIKEQIFDPEQRALVDSMEKQKEEFAIQREGIATSRLGSEPKIREQEMTSPRMQIFVKECDERQLMKEAPKSMNFVSQRSYELGIETGN